MLSLIRSRLTSTLIATKPELAISSAIRFYSHSQENEAEFDSKWESYFRKYLMLFNNKNFI